MIAQTLFGVLIRCPRITAVPDRFGPIRGANVWFWWLSVAFYVLLACIADMARSNPSRSDTERSGVVDLTGLTENIGGKEPNGKPAAIGRWTFETKKVRDTLLPYLEGRVLNAFAGKTRLDQYKNGIVEVRNDINPERDADYHLDAGDLADEFDEDSFDVLVLDPPFDQQQANELYDGLHARDMGPIRRSLAPLVKPGGRIVEFGWSLWGAADYLPLWEGEEKLLFRRGIPDRHPVLMVVDRKSQATFADGGTAGWNTNANTTDQ